MIETAINSVERELRKYISQEDEQRTYIYTKILSHLINCWIEVRVLTLAYDHRPFRASNTNDSSTRQWVTAFSSIEINEILSASTFKEKWITALNIAICKSYGVNRNRDISLHLSFTPRQRYIALKDIINNELQESYELRNRISHGQWNYAFTNDLQNISQEIMPRLRQENIVDLQLKLKLFKAVAQTVHDLSVSLPTFERDFDKNFKVIEKQRNNSHNRDYGRYKQQLIAKYQRGLQIRRLSEA